MHIQLSTTKNDDGGVKAEIFVDGRNVYDWNAYSQVEARQWFNTIRDKLLKFEGISDSAIAALCYITRTGSRLKVGKIGGVEPLPDWAIELDQIGAADLVAYEDEGYKFIQSN